MMITLFNRREVRVTRRLEERFEICSLLEANGIPTATRTNSMTNPGRSRGMIGIRADYAKEYRIYVHQSHYDAAIHLLRRAQTR